MNAAWQHLTLSRLPADRWGQGSFLYRWLFGSLTAWREGSWLMQYAEAIAAVLVGLLLVVSPFFSTSLIGILLVACAGFWVLFAVCDKSDPGVTPVRLLVLLYWGIATVATALSPVKMAAFSGWVKLSLYLFFFLLCDRILRSRRILSWLNAVYLHVAIVVSGYGLRQYFFRDAEAKATWTDPTSASAGVDRVFSFLGNPNLLGGYILPAICLSAAAIFVWRGLLPKALAVIMFLVNTLCLVLTYSRGAWVGFVAAGFVFALLLADWWSFKLPQRWRKWAVPGVVIASVLVVAMAVLFVEPIRDRVASIFAGRDDSSNNFRLNVWFAAIDMIRDRPLIGIGPGNSAFNLIYPLYMKAGFSALSAYSVLLETAVETGFIGLIAFLWLLLVTLVNGVAKLRQSRELRDRHGYWLMAGIAILCGMMAHGLVDTVWYRPQVNTLWWFAVAIVSSYTVLQAENRESLSDRTSQAGDDRSG